MQRAVADAQDACADIRGLLRVGFTAAWSGEIVLQAGDLLSARYPHCTVELLDVSYNDTAIAALRAKHVDLLIAEPPVQEPDVVVGPVVFCEPRALVVPARHPLAQRKTVTLEDLALLPLVTTAGISAAWSEELFPQRTPLGRHIARGPTAGGWQGVLSLVGAGKGATVRAGRYYVRPDIAYVPFEDADPIAYALMWRDEIRSAELRALVQTVLDVAPTSA
ncbi:LysR family substrate-binding domain-containing protein [Streptomyces sp. NPDC087866]|uniref:LysR family substrate-binding domain-containing protein n=1 Tax=unclassified Streptomyces TaxID=2593676 RepID=UPI0033AFDB37